MQPLSYHKAYPHPSLDRTLIHCKKIPHYELVCFCLLDLSLFDFSSLNCLSILGKLSWRDMCCFCGQGGRMDSFHLNSQFYTSGEPEPTVSYCIWAIRKGIKKTFSENPSRLKFSAKTITQIIHLELDFDLLGNVHSWVPEVVCAGFPWELSYVGGASLLLPSLGLVSPRKTSIKKKDLIKQIICGGRSAFLPLSRVSLSEKLFST